MNDHDIAAAADEIAYHRDDIAKVRSGPPRAWDFISSSWSHCAGWLAECRPDVVELLSQGRVREALGIAFAEGQRLGELHAFMDPARHSVLSEVDGRMVGTVASPELVKSRKRHRDHRAAGEVITEEFQKAVNQVPHGSIQDWTALLPPKGVMVRRLWKEHRVPRKIAEEALPDWWPKGRRGPRPKKPSAPS